MIPDTVRDDPLDRPAISARGITAESLLYALLIAFVLCTRLRDLGARTYCHDESIHAWESWKLATGQGYAHDPAYHGPLLYHLTALVFVLFGDSDVTGRLAAALVGSALTLAPLFLRPWLGRRGALAAMLLMALSPVLMHRSRFIRHDQFAALANLVLLVATLRYLERREQRYLYWAAAAIAVGLSTKETSFIFHTILGLFLALLVLARWIRVRPLTWSAFTASSAFDLAVVLGTLMLPLASPLLIRLLGRDPLSLTSSAIAFSAGVFVAVQVLAAAIGLAWNRRTWLVCVAIFYGIFAPLHTTFFTNWPGFATGMVGQLGYWLAQHGLARGGQPWFYYLILMPMYEFAPLLIGLAGMVYYAVTCRRTAREAPAASEASDAPNSTPFVPLLIGWCIGSFALYSWAGEKMPWLTMHLAIPWHLLAGWTLGKLLDARSQPVGNSSIRLPLDAIGATARGAALAATALLLLLTVRFAWMATFLHGDVANEFLVYAQGAPDVGRVARELEALSFRLTGGLHLAVAYDKDASWPFVWYLRNYTNGQYFGERPSEPLDAQVVIVGERTDDDVRPLLMGGYQRYAFRLIWWPYQDWYIDWTPRTFWQEMASPQGRQQMWDIVWRRQYPVPLERWPEHLVHRFYLYVRDNIAPDYWAGSFASPLAGAVLPQ